jgi:hypothetical protein
MKSKLILGGPGSGKTHRLLRVLEEEFARGLPPDRLAFVSFTKKAVQEAKDRVASRFNLDPQELIYCRTLHSMTLHCLGLTKTDVMTHKHRVDFGQYVNCRFSAKDDLDPFSGTQGDRGIFLDNYARLTCRPLRDVWECMGEELRWHWLKWLSDSLREYKQKNFLVDYTDMLTDYLEFGEPLDIDVAIIDEAQDLSPVQWKVAQKAFVNAERLYVAGDDDQCHPAGTKILTANGEKRIEDLVPGVDRIVSYDKQSAEIRRNGYDFEMSVRPYHGGMYDVQCGGKSVRATTNHRWPVRWSKSAQGKSVVYLMRQGERWRVGWCQLMRSDGIFHVWHRARIEKADAVWILKVFDTKKEASLYESVVAARFGIPTIVFEPNGHYYDRAGIDSVFDMLPALTECALNCLSYHGRKVEFPFASSESMYRKRGGSQTFELQSCNLFSDILCMAVPVSRKKVKWEPITVSPFGALTFVYSLNVHKHHLYFADGILTHNSIYKWSGADVQYFLDLRVDETEVLPRSHRLAPKIHKYSQEIIQRVRYRYPKDFAPVDGREGKVVYHRYVRGVPVAEKGTWLLLARNRMFLKEFESLAREQGLLYTIKGTNSVKKEDVEAIEDFEALRGGSRVSGKRANRVLRRAGREAVFSKDDTVRFPDLNLRDTVWHEALEGISFNQRVYYVTALRRGADLTKKPRIAIDTIHGVKGGEADHVAMMSDMTSKTWKNFRFDPDDEWRCFYVGATRTRGNLHLVLPTTPKAFQL